MAKQKEVFTISIKSDDDGVYIIGFDGKQHRPARMTLADAQAVTTAYAAQACSKCWDAWIEKRKAAAERMARNASS